MYALIKKEIAGFFSSITGYVIIVVFLVVNGLFMWVFPGELNILDAGYSNLDTLFLIAPWVFLFLIPALTMRMFSEEKKTGTIELLVTKPLTDMQIIYAKYIACIFLVFFALIPSLIYFLSVYLLGNPVGNLDSGGIWGSYIGLFFLASVYVAIGLFASSLSDNQIVAFILAVLISFFFYIGFESIGGLGIFKRLESFIVHLGINEHYKSMKRGVLDTRDIVYFISLVLVFNIITRTILKSRTW